MSKPAFPVVQWQVAGTSSSMVKCDGNQLIGFVTGGTLVSTTMTFSMVPSTAAGGSTGPTYIPVKDSSGLAISFTVTTNSYYGFSQDQIAKFTGVEVFKFVGGSSEAAGTTIQPIIVPRQY